MAYDMFLIIIFNISVDLPKIQNLPWLDCTSAIINVQFRVQ